MKKIFLLIIIFLFIACEHKQPVDLLVMGGKIYTVNKDFDLAKGFVVNDGKIVEIGEGEKLVLKYEPKRTYDALGKTIVPGLIDAHAHFYGLGLQLQKVDVTDTKSFDEVIEKIVRFQKKHQTGFITGRGWDQNDWKIKKFPTKDTLDKLFPHTPVAITRIDGHAMLVNQKALDLAGINKFTKVKGGEVKVVNGKLTGILIDNAMTKIFEIIPQPTEKENIKALISAQDTVFKYGLTTIDDAGLSKEIIMLMDSLQQTKDLKVRLYAMVQNQQEDLDYFLNKGILKTDRLNVRSVKVYADGALGSRGAALKKEYSDQPEHYGAMLIGGEELKELAMTISQTDYQMNTHAIGDSANYTVLKVYDSVLKYEKDKRWRVEHAQILSENDFNFFKGKRNIIPSVQPTHATSDMYWAEDRIGKERLHHAYAYKKLLDKAGLVALGTDFPIEKVNPLLTFYAAIARKDASGYPKKGFQPENALSRKEALRGMTIWAAYANFEENEKGSIETGKFADFTVLDRDILEIPEKDILKAKVKATFINGEEVYTDNPSKIRAEEVHH